MVAAVTFLPDQPELVALAQLASISATRMAAAYSDPDNFFEHLTLLELDRIRDACERLAQLTAALAAAVQPFLEQGKAVLEGANAD